LPGEAGRFGGIGMTAFSQLFPLFGLHLFDLFGSSRF